MTKADLVEQVYEAIGPGVTKKDCAAIIDAFLNAVKQSLSSGEHIEIRGFGTFKVRRRKPRLARNPRTGDPVRVPSRAVPVFKPSRLFKEEVAEAADRPVEPPRQEPPAPPWSSGGWGGGASAP
ncbi:MAG: integration host factor subunit beta [Gemmatimonadota bacterium]|jgi:nucleoid DNA-binding protein|nr:MAG: integration host factor subunit beta [Gemmatimonadota bacterium]